MINWNNYFDKAFCIFHVPKNGINDMLRGTLLEFDRVGLESPFLKLRMSTKNKYRDIMSEVIKFGAENGNIILGPETIIDIVLNHYEAIKVAYNLGYEKVLFFEDDVRFLRDTSIIESYLNSLPEYDICLFDWMHTPDVWGEVPINSCYTGFKWGYFLADMYALSRKGMRYMIDNIESQVIAVDWYFAIDDDIQMKFGDTFMYYKNKSIVDPVKIAAKLQLCCQEPKPNDQYHQRTEFIKNTNFQLYNTQCKNITIR